MTPPLLNKPFVEIRHGHRYRKCEQCKEVKRERGMVRLGEGINGQGHWVCSYCRSAKRQLEAIVKERPALFKLKHFIKKPEYDMLRQLYKSRGLSDAQITLRFSNLRNRLGLMSAIRRERLVAQRRKDKLNSAKMFKEEFGKLTERKR